jgi:CHAT domain-containing protein
MLKKLLTLIPFICLFLNSLQAQCPALDSVRERIIFLSGHSNALPPHDQLLELIHDGEIIKTCSFRDSSLEALLLQRIGVMHYFLGDYLKAIYFTIQSLKTFPKEKGHSAENLPRIVNDYSNLADYYDGLGRIPDKMKAIDSCIVISVRFKFVNTNYLAQLTEKVDYLLDIGDYDKSYTYARLGEQTTEGLSKDPDMLLFYVNFFNKEISSLINLKSYPAAESLINKNMQKIRTIAKNDLGAFLEQYAELQVQNGNHQMAARYFDEALQAYRHMKFYLGCFEVMENMGYLLYFKENKDFAQAIACYQKALGYRNGIPRSALKNFELLNLYTNFADVYVRQGRFDSAFSYFQLAFDQLKPGSDESDLLKVSLDSLIAYKKINFLTALVIDKGDACLIKWKTDPSKASLKETEQIYRIADLLLEKIKTQQTEITSKLFWRQDSRRLYEHAIEACYLDNDPEDAYYFFERSRAVLLNDQLNQLSGIGNDEILAEAQVKLRILQLDNELGSLEPGSQRFRDLQLEILSQKQELDRLVNLIRDRNPMYYQSFLDTSFISLQAVRQNLLSDHQALLEMFCGDSAIYSVLITPGQTILSKINKTEYDNTSAKYNFYLSNASQLNNHFDDFIQTANHLYCLLFQNKPIPAGRIIISPDGPNIPFEALVVDHSKKIPEYFLNDHALSYTYSARYLLNHFSRPPLANGANFLGVAPVIYRPGFSLAALPESDLSLAEISSYFGDSRNLIAAEASKSNFLEQFSSYKIIQLYTHSFGNSARGEPVIYFSDSALYLSELIPVNKPSTQLIVLSACETGNGKLNVGEGVFSFNRGFASMGVPASVINLWAVDNQATYQLTELFYRFVADGFPTDIALQKAKLAFLKNASKEKSLPYYWAAPILSGKTDILSIKKNHLWRYLVFFGSILGLGIFGWVKWTGRRINIPPQTG